MPKGCLFLILPENKRNIGDFLTGEEAVMGLPNKLFFPIWLGHS